MGLTAQTGTILDEAEEFTEDEEVSGAPDIKDKDLVTRKGSWHSHISQRSRDQELSIGGICCVVLVFRVDRQFKTFYIFNFHTSLAILSPILNLIIFTIFHDKFGPIN